MFDSLNQGTYNAYTELEKTGVIDYYEHVSVLDSSTSHTCQTRDNRKYYLSIDKINPSDRPPIHFNCRSKLVPRTDLNKDNNNERASQFGSVKDEPYPTWFKKQSPEFQKSVLGKSKFELYKKGTFEIKSLPDVYGKKLSLKQIEKATESLVSEKVIPEFKATSFDRDNDLHLALSNWTGGDDYHIKQSFRDGIAGNTKKLSEIYDTPQLVEIQEFDKLFKNYKETQYKEIYRGLHFEESNDFYNKASKLKVGDTFSDNAPASFTKDLKVAEEFTGYGDGILI